MNLSKFKVLSIFKVCLRKVVWRNFFVFNIDMVFIISIRNNLLFFEGLRE